jgi:hypothetical protein
MHIHVKKGAGDGKIWLEPEIKTAYLIDFKAQEVKFIMDTTEKNFEYFKQKWHEYYSSK